MCVCTRTHSMNHGCVSHFYSKYKSVKQQYCVYNAVFTILGSWLGAFVILLDWNTSLQVRYLCI